MNRSRTPTPTVPFFALAAKSVLAALTGSAGAYALAVTLGWSASAGAVQSVTLSLAPTLAAAMAGLLVLALVIARDLSLFAIGVVAAGVSRMLLALSLALVVFVITQPEGRTFWTAFLAANLLCLLAETAWGIAANQHLHRPSAGDRAGAVA